MGKLSIISRHVILFSSSRPVPAIILIDDDYIEDIIQLDEDPDIDELCRRYDDYNPILALDEFVIPGLIDINVRQEWDTGISLTQMGVAGGVTTLILEDGIY